MPEQPKPPYELMISEEHWKAIEALPHKSQQEDAIDFLMKYVPYTPKQRLANGDLKELKGEHKGFWQYDIDRDYRIIYKIDDNARTVNIEYIGYHPDWGRRSGGGGRIRR